MSLVRNEQAKLTAGYLNAAAGSFLTAGVVAPLAAAMFGLAGPGGPVPTLTLALGVLIFFAASLALHLAARHVLWSLAS